jgi:hypothetical protein
MPFVREVMNEIKQGVTFLFAVRWLSSSTHSLKIVNKVCPLENQLLGCWLLEKCQCPVRCMQLESQETGRENGRILKNN